MHQEIVKYHLPTQEWQMCIHYHYTKKWCLIHQKNKCLDQSVSTLIFTPFQHIILSNRYSNYVLSTRFTPFNKTNYKMRYSKKYLFTFIQIYHPKPISCESLDKPSDSYCIDCQYTHTMKSENNSIYNLTLHSCIIFLCQQI